MIIIDNKTVSVVIATKDRAEALDTISLPSLVAQDCCDFEVVIWDATEDHSSEKICENYVDKFKKKNIDFKYFKAPRSGLCSQRNDSVKKTVGKYIFFIDDDSKVSVDGISVLIKTFEDNPDRMGIGLPLTDNKLSPIYINDKSKYILTLRAIKKIFENILVKVFHKNKLPRRMLDDGCGKEPLNDTSGDAEWLNGGAMSFRKEVFEKNLFDERLERISKYAWLEDSTFSHKIMVMYNTPLIVASSGSVVHLPTNSGRNTDRVKKYAMLYYNRFIARQNFGVGEVKNKYFLYKLFLNNIFHNFITFRFQEFKLIKQGFKMALETIKLQKIEDKKNAN